MYGDIIGYKNDDDCPNTDGETDPKVVESMEFASYNTHLTPGFQDFYELIRETTVAAAVAIEADVLCL